MARGRIKGDHAAKRAEIAAAACAAILRLGLDRASLADIAREMGYTTGILRHYFADKDELLLFAKNQLFDRVSSRAREVAGQVEGVAKLELMALEYLAIDSTAVDRYRLLITFNGHAIGDSKLMKLQHKRNESTWALFTAAIEGLQRAGHLSGQLDAQLEAFGLVAFVEGLSEQVVMNPMPGDRNRILPLLRRYVAMLAEGRPPRTENTGTPAGSASGAVAARRPARRPSRVA